MARFFGERFFIFVQKTKVFIFIVFSVYFMSSVEAPGYSPEKAEFSIKFKDKTSPLRVFSVFVLPEEELTLEALCENQKNRHVLRTSAGRATQKEVNKWQWKAPREKGLYTIKIFHEQSMDPMTLNIFVMVPFDQLKGEYLNGYRIGSYPNIPWKKLPIYRSPRGFIEVTKENEETFISPHFKLKQFLCKQKSDYPKYIVLREELLLKLELILEKVNEKGFQANTFNILSGYRTPYYNRAIGDVKYSRHVFGCAADIFIDENPKDDLMDDLNKDGRINYRDAAVLYKIIDEMYVEFWYRPFLGGLGKYKKTASHGPFVHIDVRGFHARW